MTLSTIPAWAQLLADPVVVPAQPAPFENVNVRLTVDDCAFNPDSVRVSAEQAYTQISMSPRACLLVGPTKVVDIQIGAFAAGKQQVAIVVNPTVGLGPSRLWTVNFEVVPLVEIAIYPPPPKPLANYGGLWWNPAESGWGLTIHQSPLRTLFAAWYVYDSAGRPTWYTFQNGRWSDFRSWSGTIYRSSGPTFFDGSFNPALSQTVPVGNATLSFDQSPGNTDSAILSYTVDGVSAQKSIKRMRF